MVVKVLQSFVDVNSTVGKMCCKLIVIRFGDQEDPLCMYTDALLERVSIPLSNYVEIYSCERNCIKELINVLGLDSPVNIMCFFNRRHIKIECSSGDINKLDFFIADEEMFTELLTLVYKAGVKGHEMVVSPFKMGELEEEK